MADIEVVSLGTIGPAGPATIAVGSVITARGRLAVGNAAGTPIALAPGASGTYLRSNGTDPLYSAILAADLPTGIDAAKIGGGGVSTTEFDYLGTLTANVQTQLDGRAALSHAHLLAADRGIYVKQFGQSAGDPSDNTASTVTWANALDYSIVLPTGTWTIHADGSLNMMHSASGVSQFRVSINGVDASPRTPAALSSTVYTRAVDAQELAGMSGTVHIYAQFRTLSSSPGTTFANNPKLFIVAERDS